MNKKILVGLLLAVLALGGGAYYYFGSSTGDLQGKFGMFGGSGTGSATGEKPCKSPKEVLMSEMIELLEEDLSLDADAYDLKAPIKDVIDGTKLKDLSEEEIYTLSDDIITAVLAMLVEEDETYADTVSDDGKDALIELLQKHIDELNALIASGTGTTSSSSSSGSTGFKSMPCGPSTKVEAEETATSDEDASSTESTSTETDEEEETATEDTEGTTTDSDVTFEPEFEEEDVDTSTPEDEEEAIETSIENSEEDSDGDGVSDEEEEINGTDPDDASSY